MWTTIKRRQEKKNDEKLTKPSKIGKACGSAFSGSILGPWYPSKCIILNYLSKRLIERAIKRLVLTSAKELALAFVNSNLSSVF